MHRKENIQITNSSAHAVERKPKRVRKRKRSRPKSNFGRKRNGRLTGRNMKDERQGKRRERRKNGGGERRKPVSASPPYPMEVLFRLLSLPMDDFQSLIHRLLRDRVPQKSVSKRPRCQWHWLPNILLLN